MRTCGKEGAVKIEKEIKHVFPRSAKDKKCNCRDDAVLNEEFDDDVAKDAMELSVFTKMRKMNELEMVKIGLADLFDLPVVDMNQLDIQQKETVFPVEGAQYYNNRTKEQGAKRNKEWNSVALSKGAKRKEEWNSVALSKGAKRNKEWNSVALSKEQRETKNETLLI